MKGGIKIKSVAINDYKQKDKSGNKDDMVKYYCNYFLVNSDITILTANSISCVTLKLELRNDKDTPFVSMRSNNINQEIRALLLKVGVTNTTGAIINPSGRIIRQELQILSHTEFKEEVETQKKIYTQTFLSNMFDALCPAIIFSMETKYATEIDIIGKKIIEILFTIDFHDLKVILNLGNSPNTNTMTSLIFMELMDGFITFESLYNNYFKSIGKENFLYVIVYAYYAIYGLQLLGLQHNDLHWGNIMIKKPTNTFGSSGLTNYLQYLLFNSDIILIDYGRTKSNLNINRELEFLQGDDTFNFFSGKSHKYLHTGDNKNMIFKKIDQYYYERHVFYGEQLKQLLHAQNDWSLSKMIENIKINLMNIQRQLLINPTFGGRYFDNMNNLFSIKDTNTMNDDKMNFFGYKNTNNPFSIKDTNTMNYNNMNNPFSIKDTNTMNDDTNIDSFNFDECFENLNRYFDDLLKNPTKLNEIFTEEWNNSDISKQIQTMNTYNFENRIIQQLDDYYESLDNETINKQEMKKVEGGNKKKSKKIKNKKSKKIKQIKKRKNKTNKKWQK